MTDFNLAALERRHNLLAAAAGLGWLAAAAVAWVLSYGILWGLFAIPAYLWGGIWNWVPSAATCRYAAWIGMALLAVEGVRYGKKLLDLESYSRSLYYAAYETYRGSALAPSIGNPAGTAYLVTQVLLIAPRSTVRAYLALRSLVFMSGEVTGHAEALIRELRLKRFWTPASGCAAHAAALYPLHKLKIVTSRVDGGEVQVRLDTDFTNRWPAPGVTKSFDNVPRLP